MQTREKDKERDTTKRTFRQTQTEQSVNLPSNSPSVQVTVTAGEYNVDSNRETETQVIKAKRVTMHPKYNSSTQVGFVCVCVCVAKGAYILKCDGKFYILLYNVNFKGVTQLARTEICSICVKFCKLFRQNFNVVCRESDDRCEHMEVM